MSDDGARTRWKVHAACRGATELMYSEDDAGVKRAKAVCATCLVRAECLDHAIENRETFGVWGGQKFYAAASSKLYRARKRAAEAS